MQVFYTTVPESGMVAFPQELRGKPLKITVEQEPTEANSKISINDFLKKYTGILKDCDIESVEAMEEGRINYILEKHKTGILSIAGILKDCPNEDIRDERYEYLMEKYTYAKNTD